ncbi:hypothetical protein G6F22_014380 [Rhizopus arrhizus]|nr:hypothetical protein G6F22_014380 [Rhizopus arrhizus]
MAAALRATGVMSANNRALQDKTLALLAAQNALTQLRLDQVLPRAGSQTVPCPQGGRALQCELVFTNSMNRSFRQVSVNVHDTRSAPCDDHAPRRYPSRPRPRRPGRLYADRSAGGPGADGAGQPDGVARPGQRVQRAGLDRAGGRGHGRHRAHPGADGARRRVVLHRTGL